MDLINGPMAAVVAIRVFTAVLSERGKSSENILDSHLDITEHGMVCY